MNVIPTPSPLLCALFLAALPMTRAEPQPPEIIKQVKPDYPDALRGAGIAGQVIVQFGVDATGAVVDVTVFKSDHAELNDLALNAVKQWTFRPAMENGKAVATRILRVPVAFALEPTPFRAYPSLEEALKLAGDQRKVVLIDFFATWCEPCKMLDRTTWKDPAVIALLGEKALAIKIDAEKNAEMAAHFNVTAYPTIVVLRPDGTVIDSLVGYRDAPAFTAEFNALLSGKSELDQAKEAVEKAGSDPDQLAQARYAHGRLLAQKGRDAEALDEFLWCFDVGMPNAPGFGGVRLSYLLEDVASLSTHYPPARQALVARRDSDRAKLEGSAGDYVSLNHALGDDKETLATFDSFPKESPERKALGHWVFEILLESKRYSDAAELQPAAQFKASFAMMRAQDRGFAPFRSYLIQSGAKAVEAQAGAGHLDEARDLIAVVLDYDHTDSAIAALREHLIRSGHPELAPQPPAATKT